jgi:hypothetical protein
MTERFGRGEEPINLGNASLVELLALVSAFGPIAQVAGAANRGTDNRRARLAGGSMHRALSPAVFAHAGARFYRCPIMRDHLRPRCGRRAR